MGINHITVSQTVRPITIGFLVDLKTLNPIKKAIVYSSYLRGGEHNIIIPIRNRMTNKKTKTHYLGLVETCKPDFIINLTNKSVPVEISRLYKADYILPEKEFVKIKNGELNFLVGIRNYGALNDILNKIKHDNLNPKKVEFLYPAITLSIKDIFLGFLFGSYKSTAFEKTYHDACSPKIIKTISEINSEYQEYFSPINSTSRHLNETGGGGGLDRVIAYFGKSDSLVDLIEYWNIRSTGKYIIYIPVDHLPVFKKVFNQFIKDGNYKINATVDNMTTCIKGMSINENDLKNSIKQIRNKENTVPIILQNRTPGWNKSGHRRIMKQIVMPEFYEYKKDIKLVSDGKTIVPFKIFAPTFITRDRLPIEDKRKYRAVDLQIFGFFGEGKTISLPFDKSLEKLVIHRMLFGSEDRTRFDNKGITIFENGFNHSYHINPIEIEKVFKEYFGFYGYDIEHSNAGIIAKKIIEHMGGHLDDCRILKIKVARDLLHELSNVLGKNDEEKKTAKEKIKKGMEAHAIVNYFKKDKFDETNVAPLHYMYSGVKADDNQLLLKHMIDKDILYPGLLFKCENCTKEDWYSIKDFTDRFKCRYCFKEQKVQLLDGSGDKKRHFKPDGLFSLPDGGQGSIAVITTLWRLDHFRGMGSDFNYITSINLTKKDNPTIKYECDFVGIVNDRYGDNECEIIIGEVKNYGNITKKEFKKFIELSKDLGKKPIICTSILRDIYSEEEKEQIKILIKKGFTVVPFTSQELDPYELYERFDKLNNKYIHSLADLSENLIKLNIDKTYIRKD